MALAQLAAENYVYLTTTGRVSGKPRTVELWFLAHEGKVYMVSERPERANWVRNIQANPRVHVRIAKQEWNGHGRVLDRVEQPLWDTVNRLICEKYHEPKPWGTPIEVTLL